MTNNERKFNVLPAYLDYFGYIDEDYVLTETELYQLAHDWEKDPEDLMYMLKEI